MNRAVLKDELTRDEALRLRPYLCSAGKTTIGVGRNLDDVGISRAEALLLLDNDIARVEGELDRALPWWRDLTEARQRVLANMCFNMGLGSSKGGLLSFRNTLAAMREGRYDDAAEGMRASLWARQVKGRAERLMQMMREG